ncbi:retrovirus-related Pol polyprotein from transposon 297 [Trichonephila clavipes]|nr:retrovirus-related Pol polyprotein from transposon 297 [Trichonephila clavipes]
MDEESKPLTAFTTHNAVYQWKTMPFGLAGASGIFQKEMNRILKSHSEYAQAYMDDVVIFSKTFEEHLVHLELVLAELEKLGFSKEGPGNERGEGSERGDNGERWREKRGRIKRRRDDVAFDNFDRVVETKSGKDTLHDTVGIIYQNVELHTPNESQFVNLLAVNNEETVISRKRRQRTFEAIPVDMQEEPVAKRKKEFYGFVSSLW